MKWLINKSTNIKSHICLTLHASDSSGGATVDGQKQKIILTSQNNQQKITVDEFMKLVEKEAEKLKTQFNNFCTAIDNINGETDYKEEITNKEDEIRTIQDKDQSSQEDIKNKRKELQILQIQQKIANLMFEFDDKTNKAKSLKQDFYKNSIAIVKLQLNILLSVFKMLNEDNNIKDDVKNIKVKIKAITIKDDGLGLEQKEEEVPLFSSTNKDKENKNKKNGDAFSIFKKNIDFITINNINSDKITDENFHEIKKELEQKIDQASEILEKELNRLKPLISNELSNAEKEKKKYQSTLEEFQKKNTWTAKSHTTTSTSQEKVEHALYVLKEAQNAFDTELKDTFKIHKESISEDFNNSGAFKEYDTKAKYIDHFKDDVSAIKQYSPNNNIETLFTEVTKAKVALETAWQNAYEKDSKIDQTIPEYIKNFKEEKQANQQNMNKYQQYDQQISVQQDWMEIINNSLDQIKECTIAYKTILDLLSQIKILKSNDLSDTKRFKEYASMFRSIYGLYLLKNHYNNYFSNIDANLANLYALYSYSLLNFVNDDNNAVVILLEHAMECNVIKQIEFPTESIVEDHITGENFFINIDVKTLYFNNEKEIKDMFKEAIEKFTKSISQISSNSDSSLVKETINLFNIHMKDSAEAMKKDLIDNALTTIALPQKSQILICVGDSTESQMNRSSFCKYLKDQTECIYCKKQSPEEKAELYVVQNEKAVSASDNKEDEVIKYMHYKKQSPDAKAELYVVQNEKIHMKDSAEEMQKELINNALSTIKLPDEKSETFRCAGDSLNMKNKGLLCEYLEDQTECRHYKKQSPEEKADLYVVQNEKAVSVSDNKEDEVIKYRHYKKQSPDVKANIYVVQNKKAVSASDNREFFDYVVIGVAAFIGLIVDIFNYFANQKNTSKETDAIIEAQVSQPEIVDQAPKLVEVAS